MTTASVGETMITLRGKLNGTIVLSAKPACTPGGQAVYMTGAIGSQNISFEIRKTQAGQNYVFPQSGARDPAIVTLVATGTPPTVWTAGPSTGKGTVAVSEAGGNIDLDVDFPDGAPQHISGRWSCV